MEIWFYFHFANGIIKPIRMNINKSDRPQRDDYILININESPQLGKVYSIVYDYNSLVITYRINEV